MRAASSEPRQDGDDSGSPALPEAPSPAPLEPPLDAEEVRELDERYGPIVAADVLVAELDLDGRMVWVSANTPLFFGLPREQVWGRMAAEFVDAEDVARGRRQFATLLESGQAARSIHRNVHTDGEPRWVESSAQVRRRPNGEVRVVSVSLDVTGRVRAESALRESAESLSRAFQSWPAMMAMTDDDGRILDVNPAFAEAFGLSREEAIGRPGLGLAVWRDPVVRDGVREQLRRTGKLREMEWRLPHASGGTIPVSLAAARVPLGHDHVVLWLGTDLTERRRAERALQESEERFEKAFRQAPTMMLITELDGTVVDVNERFARTAGARREEVLGAGRGALGAWGDPELRQRILEQLDQDGAVRNVEAEFHPVDGGPTRYGVVSAQKLFLNGRECVLWQADDVTQRKRAEEALARYRDRLEDLVEARTRELEVSAQEIQRRLDSLRTSEERYRALTEHAQEAIGEWDSQGRLLYANPAWKELLGRSPDDVLGQRVDSWLHPEDLTVGVEHFNRLVRDGGRYQQTFRIRHHDGSWVWIEGRITAFQTGDGERRVMAIWRDVTERRQMEQELKRKERLASIGTLAAGIAHEINNPVESILLAAQYAQRRRDHPEAERIREQALDDIVEAARRCGRIVKSVLHFSQQRPADLWTHDMRDVLRGAIDLVRRAAETRAISLRVHLPSDPLPVRVNPTQIEQVVVNLVQNALACGVECTRVKIGLERLEHSARLTVEDDGPGLTESECSRAFDPFFTTRQKSGGSGLGLSVSHGIVLQHGGTITLESEPGEGTRVRVELPLSHAAGGQEETS